PPAAQVAGDVGGAAPLPGLALPALALPASDGSAVDLSSVPGRVVVFAYPRTGNPTEPDEHQAEWDAIPGARGCTPQNCAIRDEHGRFAELGITVFGLSAQPPEE